ncbi:galactokinase [Clostridium gasigenes]|uniref:Galactokinase n=1 Tax=Clostridium gasigenes TaxID=94869 RepID=A0A7X0S980_9CLOT|nr:galactokinase [Clostridium gasigenes]MBB6713398.1 galactokinase [Clostridium gasigenes]
MINELKSDFNKIYNKVGERAFFSPGRVNLIGEHTDYNGGNVFPCALDMGTFAIVSKREDELVRAYSNNFKELGVIEFSLENLINIKEDDWGNYPKGVIKMFVDEGHKIDNGFDILFHGNIPNGSGLSSSASIELATAIVLKNLFSLDVDMVSMVKLAQKAENKFIGVNCGIMDQFAIGMGKANCAILLDTKNIIHKYVPLDLKDSVIVIANTNKRRGLADSKYNERRYECDTALGELKEVVKINELCDLCAEDFEKHSGVIKNDVNRRRAKHAIYENERTKKAVVELEKGDLKAFGKLMNASHVSLRDDYEVTGIELDTLVELAWMEEGVIGSRMTGAGFGGCTVSIVNEKNVESFMKNVGAGYKDAIGYDATFYIGRVGDGTREI